MVGRRCVWFFAEREATFNVYMSFLPADISSELAHSSLRGGSSSCQPPLFLARSRPTSRERKRDDRPAKPLRSCQKQVSEKTQHFGAKGEFEGDVPFSTAQRERSKAT